MDLNYLKDLLYDANRLTYLQPQKGDDLRIKVIDALKELNLYDANVLTVTFLKFTAYDKVSSHRDFNSSKQTLISVLESKIKIYEARISRAVFVREQQEKSKQEAKDNSAAGWIKIANDWEAVCNSQAEVISALEEDVKNLTEDKHGLLKSINSAKRIWGLKSVVVWGAVLTVVTTFSLWLYGLGKDNGQSKYDSEKNELAKAVDRRDSIIVIKNFQIDSLKKLVPETRPVN